jgi:tetratricopeptide (TPR) repeat protein
MQPVSAPTFGSGSSPGRFRAPRNLLRACLGASLVGALALPCPAQRSSELDAIWDDPVFQKQFVGAYGINAEVEPRVTLDEIELLEEIRPLMARDLPKAEAALAKAIEPESSAILDFTLGGIQFQQDELDAALANYHKAVTKFPSFRRAWRNIGLIHARAGAYEKSIAAFTRMIELGGGDAYSYGLLGFAHSARLDYQPAEAAYRSALLLQPDNTEWRLGLTRCVFKQGKFQDAAALLDALIARFPDKPDFWVLQAQAYLSLGRPLDAAANMEAVDRLGLASADGLYTLGDIYVSEDLAELALGAYLRAFEADPSQSIAKPLRAAELLSGRGAIEQAAPAIERIQTLWADRMADAERSRLLKLDARVAMARGGADERAAAVLEQVVALDPLDGEALLLLGQHFESQQEPDRAMLYYERAANVESSEHSARIRHAQVLVKLGRYADAIPLLRRAQEIRPRDDVLRYLEQVERFAKAR